MFAAYFRPHLGWFVGGTLMALGTSLCAMAYTYVLKLMGDRLEASFGETGNADSGWILHIGAAIVALAAARSLTMYLMTLLNNTGVQRGLVTMQAHEFKDEPDGFTPLRRTGNKTNIILE